MAKETFYITTPIYYPNDTPHLGHAYTTIASDVIARWQKLQGKEVFFLTGTDEHGKKIEDAAKKQGKKPKEFIDKLIPEYKKDWKILNIEYDRFIRTTDKDHEAVVQQILQKLQDNGDIYLGEYEGLYCTSCEAYYTEKDVINLNCPIHEKPLEKLKEKSYFFKLSKYQKFLLNHYKKNKDFILPKKRAQEVINRVEEGLKDLSISRTSFDWGIPLPFDKKHISFVWVDALFNYYSATQSEKRLNKFWPADLHLIGKDILWFHTVYWPALLEAVGLPLPKSVFAHGWWTVNSKKMGKSAGNAIKIDQLVKIAGVDSARYFLLRETPLGEDGDFSSEMLIERHNTELANKLGNLVSRVSTLAEKYGIEKTKVDFHIQNVVEDFKEKMENYELDKALQTIFAFIDTLNEFVQEKKPWETRDKEDLYELVIGIRLVTFLLSPFIPSTAEKIAKTFNFKISLDELDKQLDVKSKIKKSEILFQKIQ
ncbi:MAG: methionine--tRNA ligase [Nanoarchaeota archaeon]